MAYHFLGGKCKHFQIPTLVRAESYFVKTTNQASITTTIYSKKGILEKTKWTNASDSAESDWMSVYQSILFSLEKGHPSIHIEHSNRNVINTLIGHKIRKPKPYIHTYKSNILFVANQTDFTGIRWIPDAETEDENDIVFALL